MPLSVEPWVLREPTLDVDDLPRTAALLTVANGHLGVRGVLEEQRPPVPDATLLSSVYEHHPHEYPEHAYGYPAHDERLEAVVDACGVDLRVDGEPFDVRTGTLEHHERRLDLRTAVLEREAVWTSPGGSTVEVRTRRWASLVRRELVVASYEVRAPGRARVRLRPVPGCGGPSSDVPAPGLRTDACAHAPGTTWVAQRTVAAGIGVVLATTHGVTASPGAQHRWVEDRHGWALDVELPADGWVRVATHGAYACGRRPVEALLADARTVLAGAHDEATLEAEHRAFLDDVWERADVLVEGDDELQQAVRLAVLHTVQSAARVEGSGLRAKGLTGTGYHGHTFWDAESFVLPVLDHVLPGAAAAHLRWRHATLPAAVERARTLGLPGAAFPWRTISGAECSGYWPAGTAAVHVTADVMDAVSRYVAVTGDDALEREVGVELLVQGARFWLGRGHRTPDGAFHLHGVTGPDEYTAVVDDNTYTNLLVARSLTAAVEATGRWPDEARRLGVDDDERARWAQAAGAVTVPYADDLGVTEQCTGFTQRPVWDFARGPQGWAPFEDHVHYTELYRHQLVKQADLVLALAVVGERFTREQKRRDFAYYEPLTVRDSSLSASAQAVVAAELGHLTLAHAYVRECAFIDLHDLRRETQEGVHVAAMAGTWDALVRGYGGVRLEGGGLRVEPRLPPRLARLRFRVQIDGWRVEVDARRDEVTYRLLTGARVALRHVGDGAQEDVVLTADDPVASRALRPVAEPTPPAQPPGREPRG
ncbi:glycoside hydrolase family 65 protein [Cellulomonas flavigena]|uniref:glycoside hydrolase family 65 protein n=1 Tax=Cellulomonas flavigena TaxID=1711 RepID=UPI0016515C30|nr:glycoside hydrolase family 65 protein [Cellulomonas flavigena]